MDNYIVRSANEYNEIKRLIYEFDTVFTPNLSERIPDLKEYIDKLFHRAKILVIEENSEYIGFAAIYTNKQTRTAYLSQIGIREERQNTRMGTLLLLSCIEISKKLNMSKLKLEVISTNDRAIKFYIKNGFEFYRNATQESIYMIKNI